MKLCKKNMLCSILLGVCLLAGCGSSSAPGSNGANAATNSVPASSAADNDQTSIDANGLVYNKDGISVNVKGVYYDESSYTWYFTWSGTNDTDTQVVFSLPYVGINGYKNNIGWPSLVAPPHETVEKDTTIEKSNLCYYCELMGENTIRDVDLTVSVYEDPDGDGNIDSYAESLIGESDGIITTNVEPLVIREEPFSGMESTVIYDDGSYRVSYIGLGEDLFGISEDPLLYILIENNSDLDITYSYDSNPQSYEDILESYVNGNTCLINGEPIKCQTVSEDLPARSKMIETIELYLSDAGINVDGIEKIEYPLEVYEAGTLEDITSFVITVE